VILLLVILYYNIYEKAFSIHKNPIEPMPKEIIEQAQIICNSPNHFIMSIFKDPKWDMISCKIPFPLTGGHFYEKPLNIGK
jgi:hypothetical protein